MTQRVVLVRHAESTNNDLYARTGQRVGRVPDPLLSARGEQQALRVATALAAEADLAAAPVWSSPTARAVQTAAAVVRGGTGRGIELHPDLVEGGGTYERDAGGVRRAVPGRSIAELTALAGLDLAWADGFGDEWDGGFEQHDVIPARAERLVAAVRGSGHPVLLLVAHEWLAQHVIRAALGLPPGNEAAERGWFRVPNASITELWFEDDGTAELVRLGVDAHLAGVPSRAPARIV